MDDNKSAHQKLELLLQQHVDPCRERMHLCVSRHLWHKLLRDIYSTPQVRIKWQALGEVRGHITETQH